MTIKPEKSSKWMLSCFQQGRLARINEIHILDCPYPTGMKRDAWVLGWRSAAPKEDKP